MAKSFDDYPSAGTLLAALLESRNWSTRTLANVMDVSESALSRILNDSRGLSPSIALQLEAIFEIKAEVFLAAQARFDLTKARMKPQSAKRLAVRSEIYSLLPIKEMLTRGWLNVDDPKSAAQVEVALAEFFGVAEASQLPDQVFAAKKTHAGEPDTWVQKVWVHRVRQIATEMLVPPYQPGMGERAAEKLKALLFSEHEVRHVPRILAEHGIRFVIVQGLKGSKIDGACLWLDDHSPVIGMSMRFDRIDNFWFVLRHELEHVIRGDGRAAPMLDEELNPGAAVSEAECAANQAAATFAVSPARIESFISRKYPFFNEIDMVGLSRTVRAHPGILAGLIRHHTGKYNILSKYLVPVRALVIPSAYADGWGEPYPLG